VAAGERLRFGIVGCGSIGPTHAGAVRQIEERGGGAELVAVADPDAGKARKLAGQFGLEKVYDGIESMLRDSDIDAVCVCTPSGMHADHAAAALRAGKHAVVEKPMDVTLDACDRLIAAEQDSGKKLAIISQHRWDAASQTVKQAIEEGKLGRIVYADATVKWWRTQEYYDSGDWRGTWAMDGGGALINQGVHTVDLLQWLAGGVQQLFAYTRTAAHERIEVEDVAAAALTFRNGAIGTLTATTVAYPGFPVRIDIYGTDGSAVIEGDRLRSLVLKNGESYEGEAAAVHAVSVARGGTASVKNEAAARLDDKTTASADPGAVWGDAHRAQIEDFLAAVRDDRRPLIDGREGRRPLEIIQAVYQSARTGLPVTLG